MGRKRNIFDIVTGEKTTTHTITIKYVKCQGRGSSGRTQQEHDPDFPGANDDFPGQQH